MRFELRSACCLAALLVPQLLSGSPEMIPEIVCQQDIHLCLTLGIDTKGKL